MKLEYDIAVLGSGFAGSLTALLVQRLGLRPVVIDRANHPRFAIGESSTPIAGMVLRDLAARYSLPLLDSLSQYGRWQRNLPQVRCGRKRGFSYFDHRSLEAFRASHEHDNELLVTACADDDHSDTHWMRADVDHTLVKELRQRQIELFEGTAIDRISSENGGWLLDGHSTRGSVQISAQFLVDASGAASILPRRLGAQDAAATMLTRSRAIYSHFTGVAGWQEIQDYTERFVRDHPFPCDDAAQHHLLDDAWMWLLRFDDGTTSAGLVVDESRSPLDPEQTAEHEWADHLSRYPSVEKLFENAVLAEQPGKIIRTERLQRLWQGIAGPNWVALPHTAGFVDPLHSSGIAQSLCGVERVTQILGTAWQTDRLGELLRDYERTVTLEFSLIDKLVAGCFLSLNRFSVFAAYSMLYFAAATTFEHRRASGTKDGAFLCADDDTLRELVSTTLDELPAVLNGSDDDHRRFAKQVAARIEPFNRVGLFSPEVPNMYRYTVAPT